MDNNLAPHLDELTRALENVDENLIKNELEKLLSYRVPVEEAKRTILRKYKSSVLYPKNIGNLKANSKGLEITGRIIDIQNKTVNVKGEKVPISSGIIADSTGACYFTLWEDMSLNIGDALKIKNAYTRKWQNRVQLNIGNRSEITYLSDESLPSVDEITRQNKKKLFDISFSDIYVNSMAIVVELYHREVNVKNRKTTILEGVLADETGKLPFTSWTPLEGVDIGKVIQFEGAFVQTFKGVPSININESTSLEIVDSTENLPFTYETASNTSKPVPIKNILNKDGIFEVSIEGNIISLRSGSGIITRCPTCNRVIFKNKCRAHGTVEGYHDMRIKAILDDGTGAITVILNRELSEIVYGSSMYEAEDIIQNTLSQDAVYEDMRRRLIGKYLGVCGNSSNTDFGPTLVAKSVWVPDGSLDDRVHNLLKRLEGVTYG
ncbi:nucleic acid binding OB-fold tRNA/helicase-type [Methanohalobium evestigatum Z-7303]|uniref:Nucleic acid binding OB-fold tRNA/helicase-type n=1 Tax=Methanohalobium evestigatum (strain ATCC BAA-1072 / DSM 3721 / NBRC 107634 / OCM 161 / Z-7303) TaxID=644295 RepID=D7EAB6_METEZ|nr:Single-stranded DNA binding protein [Methanohalobium evestigatum]ADI74787.1 nucleic acid binding OB-fold tRNA/helicase-type [Methanohalobium evestigatum Z-7303]